MTYAAGLADNKRPVAAALRVLAIAGAIGLGLAVGWRQAQWSTPVPDTELDASLRSAIRAGDRLDGAAGGFTPLMAAAYCGDQECVQFLLERGAPVNARTPAGLTALIEATLSGNVAVVQALLARGAEPNPRYQLEPPRGQF